MLWIMMNGGDPEMLGFLPSFIDENDPRPAREQFDANYQYGGYWRTVGRLDDAGVMYYPGDPPMPPIAMTVLREETIYVYPTEFVAIVQPDGSFVTQRMD